MIYWQWVYEADLLNICDIGQRKIERKMKDMACTHFYLNDIRDNEKLDNTLKLLIHGCIFLTCWVHFRTCLSRYSPWWTLVYSSPLHTLAVSHTVSGRRSLVCLGPSKDDSKSAYNIGPISLRLSARGWRGKHGKGGNTARAAPSVVRPFQKRSHLTWSYECTV